MLAKRVMPAVTIPRESSETFRQLVDDVQDVAIFMLDGAGRVSTWNSGAERIKGYRAEEIVGQHFHRFYPPEAVAEGKPARLLAIAARDGQVEDEGWRVRKDGARFWAEVTITALRDSEGAVIGFAKVTRDLTARKEAQDALHRSEQTFQLLVESIQDCAISCSTPTGGSPAGTPLRSASRGTAPTRSWVSTSRRSIPRTMWRKASRNGLWRSRSARAVTRTKGGACARTARASGPIP